jgi:glycosyltransferase involved in cell wall biosynthesis
MNYGGVETWLMHVLRHTDRTRFQMDFLVHSTEPGVYDEEIRALGARILVCPNQTKPWIYARNFQRILREAGPYDVVHSHVHHFSGYVLQLAHHMGVPIRIAHSHNDTSAEDRQANLFRRMYLRLMEERISRYATVGLAASRKAGVSLFRHNWEQDPRWRVLYCGVDFAPFLHTVDHQAIRTELGIPDKAFVIGHVGRFNTQKNHQLLVQIATEVVKYEPRTHFLLVGTGPLRPMIEQQVAHAGLGDHITFAGVRSDVPRIMLGAMDVFIMPSLYEGLPLVGMEAQAAGLPWVLSDTVTGEVDMIPQLIRRLSPSQPASVWATALLEARNAARSLTQPMAQAIMQNSPFSVQSSMQELEHVYVP